MSNSKHVSDFIDAVKCNLISTCFEHLRVYEKPQSHALHQCTCVQQPVRNYLKGVEHHSGLI